MIKVNNATLTYRSGKGVFDLNFQIAEGQVMGYLGPNGAGKTTTIRQLTGFMKSDQGSCTINGLDCFKKAAVINKTMGYIPGEMAFIEGMKGNEYLKYIALVRGLKNLKREKEMVERFELNPYGSIRKFSKGMKQKLGIVAAFMHDPQVLILDEPTSGLDPLMQNRFVDLILEEKKRGKTILMSSHMVDEVERTCDNVIIIREGRIVAQSDIKTLKSSQRRVYHIKTAEADSLSWWLKEKGFEAAVMDGYIEASIVLEQTNDFIKTISAFEIKELNVKMQSLEDIFMHFYKEKEKEK